MSSELLAVAAFTAQLLHRFTAGKAFNQIGCPFPFHNLGEWLLIDVPQADDPLAVQTAGDDGSIYQHSGLATQRMAEALPLIFRFLQARPFEFMILIQVDVRRNLHTFPRLHPLLNLEVQSVLLLQTVQRLGIFTTVYIRLAITLQVP